MSYLEYCLLSQQCFIVMWQLWQGAAWGNVKHTHTYTHTHTCARDAALAQGVWAGVTEEDDWQGEQMEDGEARGGEEVDKMRGEVIRGERRQPRTMTWMPWVLNASCGARASPHFLLWCQVTTRWAAMCRVTIIAVVFFIFPPFHLNFPWLPLFLFPPRPSSSSPCVSSSSNR